MNDIDEFKQWLHRMEHYGTLSGGTLEVIINFVDKQQEVIKQLKDEVN